MILIAWYVFIVILGVMIGHRYGRLLSLAVMIELNQLDEFRPHAGSGFGADYSTCANSEKDTRKAFARSIPPDQSS